MSEIQPVYLVRHGQSTWNVEQRTQGQIAHPPLTVLGREQARGAAEFLEAECSRLGVHAGSVRILSSDLVRAFQTAQIIAEHLDITEVSSEQRLREQNFGVAEGASYEETRTLEAAVNPEDPSDSIKDGESLAHVAERMFKVLTELDRSVVNVLVTHGDSLRALHARLMDLPMSRAEAIWSDNGSVTLVRAANDAVPSTEKIGALSLNECRIAM